MKHSSEALSCGLPLSIDFSKRLQEPGIPWAGAWAHSLNTDSSYYNIMARRALFAQSAALKLVDNFLQPTQIPPDSFTTFIARIAGQYRFYRYNSVPDKTPLPLNMSSQSPQNQLTGQEFVQLVRETTTDSDEQLSLLDQYYHAPWLSLVDRRTIARRRLQLLRRRIGVLERRVETLTSQRTTVRLEPALSLSDEDRPAIPHTARHITTEALQPMQSPAESRAALGMVLQARSRAQLNRLSTSGTRHEAHQPLQPLLSLPEPFSTQLEEIREAEYRIQVFTASMPVSYGDPYDKLVGRGDEQDQPRLCPCGQHPIQPSREVTIPRAPGSRREYTTLDNRALIQARQARHLAHLDTSAMDEEISFRLLQHPVHWGNLGFVVEQHWGQMMERHS
jgi:hypothetical protein